MPRKKKIMDSVVFNNGGSKTMIKPVDVNLSFR